MNVCYKCIFNMKNQNSERLVPALQIDLDHGHVYGLHKTEIKLVTKSKYLSRVQN